MGFRACVWDLDGTLLYTLPTIHHYCNQSLRHFGFHDITLDECRDLCRLSIAEFYHKLLKLGGCPPDRVDVYKRQPHISLVILPQQSALCCTACSIVSGETKASPTSTIFCGFCVSSFIFSSSSE